MRNKRKSEAERRAQAMARVQPIIEAAEQAATSIIEEAEAQARKQIEVARARADVVAREQAAGMTALTEALIEKAENVKREADELLETLNRTRRGMEAVGD